MSGHRYVSNPSNLFADDDENDEQLDNDFMNRYQPSPSSSSSTQHHNNLLEQQLSYEQRRANIENRTLESTGRSLGLLHETEQVGMATAEELAKQREQLENTNKQLDDINTTLRFSQKHLNGLKSVFGGLRNYLSGQRDQQPPTATGRRASEQSESTFSMQNYQQHSPGSPPDRSFDAHPVARLRGISEQVAAASSQPTFDERLDRNLDDMAGSLSRLKGLAIDLNQDIESQNDLIDTIHNKVENVDVKLQRQNKDMNKLLGKK